MAGAESRPGATSLARIYPLILLCTAIWGGTPVAGKLAIRDLPPMTVGVLRYGLASLALMVLFGRHLPSWRELRRSDLWVLLGVGVLGTFLNHVLFFLGLIFAPASHGAIIPPTTSPIWTMLLAARLAREQITRSQIAGTVVCMVGVVLVARPDGLGSTASARLLLGDLFYLLGGMAWWVLGERLTPLQLFGGLLTVAGVWVCQGPGAMQAAWRQARVRLGGERVAAPEKR
ncbi:MAG: DMT family transporter [candidate division NC10 bacterium]|nr:DMT family transporter [candidate division NC10 bacterium]